MATEIGTRIRRARERLRWSQQRLADEIGVDRKTVGNWESGRSSPRSAIGALEQILGPLTGPAPQPVLATDFERRLWAELAKVPSMNDEQRWAVITGLRRSREGNHEPNGEEPARRTA